MPRSRRSAHLEAARSKMYRELVFECAERVFAEQGYAGTTMNDIAAEAGISLKTLYSVYRGKKELYADIRERRGREFLSWMMQGVGSAAGAIPQLAQGVRLYVAFLLDHRDFFRIQIREGRSWGLGPTGDGAGQWPEGLELQMALLRQGVEEGVFCDGDIALLAASGGALMQVLLAGILEREAAAGNQDLDREVIAQELEGPLRRLLLRPGVAPPETC